MSQLIKLWRDYNYSANELKNKLKRTSNLVGEYAEYLINEFLEGELLPPSNSSADIQTKECELYQVKARKLSASKSTTQLSVIRSWDFDFLAVILFNQNGEVRKSLICSKDIAKKYAADNGHQNGWVISTTKDFLSDPDCIDITMEIRKLNGDNEKNIDTDNSDLDQLKQNKKIKTHYPKLINKEIEKVENKVPKWFSSPNQINSQILLSYMELYDLSESVDYTELENRCKDVNSFKSNIDQMLIISEKNHAKVFEKEGKIIKLWNPVKDFIKNEYKKIQTL